MARSLTLKGLFTAVLGLVVVYFFGDRLADLGIKPGDLGLPDLGEVLREKPERAEPHGAAGRPKVVDGDTIKVDGETLRLTGMDAPEKAQTCRAQGREVGCGQQATQHLEKLVGVGGVTCEIEKRRDKYGRGLARCEARGRDLAETMIKDGWALAFLDKRYEPAQAAARASRRGLWAMEFEHPSEWRKAQGQGRRPVASIDDLLMPGAYRGGRPEL